MNNNTNPWKIILLGIIIGLIGAFLRINKYDIAMYLLGVGIILEIYGIVKLFKKNT